MRTVEPSRAFVRNLKGLADKDAKAVIAALEAFLRNPMPTGLNFEKVRARPGFFTIRANRGVRVLLKERARGEYVAVAVGGHDYVYRSYFKG